ncbi:MAG: glycosyltransferase, partial [Sphingomonadaceae bacterium]|nr:glycosyltransferase [Sphingomonadaceae bacterium]
GHGGPGEALLSTGLDAIPDSSPLIGVKLERLTADGDLEAMEAYAASLLDAGPVAAENLESALFRMNRAGIPDGHPLIRKACARLAEEIDGDAEAATYAALGLDHYAALERPGAATPDDKRGPDIIAAEALPPDPFAQAFALIDGSDCRYTPDDRLLLFGNSLACGGMERVLAQTYRHFAAGRTFEHVDLALFNYAEGQPSSHHRDEAGVRREDIELIEARSPAGSLALSLPYSLAGRAQRLDDYIREKRPSVIHAWNDITGVLAALCGLAAGCPRIVIHFHHTSVMPLSARTAHPASFPSIYRRLIKQPGISTIFCAEMAARDYANWWSLPFSDAFRTIRNGFDWPDMPDKAAARALLGLPEAATIVGTVTRFDPVKQMDRWAEAAIAYAQRDPDAHFLLVGDGPERADIEAAFAAAGLANRSHFAGRIEQTEDYYAAMDAFWMTSLSEGLPTVCIEAAAAGVPVIAFDVGGVRETVVDGETGHVVAPNDVNAMVSQTQALLADDQARAKLGAAGAAFARAEFSFDRYIAELTKVYEGQ